MDGVSGAFAIVSLTIQLAETIRKIKVFLREFRNAPKEVHRLIELLNQLEGCFNQVKELIERQNSSSSGSPALLTPIKSALENCERKLVTLESFVNGFRDSFARRRQLPRTWASLRIMSKKGDIQDLQNQLRDATMTLHLAISIHSALQINHMDVAAAHTRRLDTKNEPKEEPFVSFSSSKKTLIKTVDEASFFWYQGFFGQVNIQMRSKSSRRSRDSRFVGKKAAVEEMVVMIMPFFMKRGFELRLLNSFGRISRTLNIYPVLPQGSQVFSMCCAGDLEGLQTAFSNGSVSPFVLDTRGWSLLHYAAMSLQKEVSSLLLQLGLDPDRTDSVGEKAFRSLGRCSYDPTQRKESIIDTLRILTQAQDEVSAFDLSKFFRYYHGPPEGVELVLSQDTRYENDYANDDHFYFPALATALREYSKSPQWEPLIRKIVRRGFDLHAPVPRYEALKYLPRECGTPLDSLFERTETPYEATAAADNWLGILSSEGYDIRAYLQKESHLHATQNQSTGSSWTSAVHEAPRKLIFHFDSNPRVSWDWWIDPESSTFLVRQEFKQVINSCRDWGLISASWADLWPFGYPAWSEELPARGGSMERERLRECAQERADRRLKGKSRRWDPACSTKKSSPMPGAWPV